MPTNISNGFQHPLGDGTLTKTNDGDGYYVALGFDEFNEDIGAAGSYHLGEDRGHQCPRTRFYTKCRQTECRCSLMNADHGEIARIGTVHSRRRGWLVG